jgi:signal transduction histidine kinase
VDAGEAVIMVGAAPTPVDSRLLDLIASVLSANLEGRADVTRMQRRDISLDRGIAWTAHEFRGPLLGAKAAIGRLVEGDADDRTIDLLRRSGRELEQLAKDVDGLLRWSVGDRALRRRQVHLGKLLHEVASACEVEHEHGRVSVAGMDGIRVWVDRSQLRSALTNLIRNALEYSPQGAPVRVSAERTNGTVTLSVRDRGPGVPPAQREAIFDPFVRATDGSLRRANRGLGLFIARRVVEAHGGRIWVESSGRGATFRIGLPSGSPG